MAETKKTHEGVVTSIADTDLVMVTGPNGGWHPISFANLMAAIKGGIQIGGRNLIPDSSRFNGWTSKTGGHNKDGVDGIFSVYRSSGEWSGGYRMMNFISGNPYTFSIYTDSPDILCLYIKYANEIFGIQTATFSPISTRVRPIKAGWFQKATTAICTSSGTALLEYESTKIPNNQSIRVCAPKLEICTIPTDWTPAPEDIASGLWGGVIGYLPITYNSEEKGGAHDGDEDAYGQAEIGTDGHLAFGTLDALCGFLGQASENEWFDYRAFFGPGFRSQRGSRHVTASSDSGCEKLSLAKQRFILSDSVPFVQLCLSIAAEYPRCKDCLQSKGLRNLERVETVGVECDNVASYCRKEVVAA